MPLGTIASIKDAAQGYASLLLFTVTFVDGTVLRLSSNPLNTTEGGYQYSGNNYFARVMTQDLGPIQALSSLGFDVVPNISIRLADADSFLWTNYEMVHGFGGARIDADLVMVDITPTGYSYSSDSQRRFSGICDPPNMEEKDGTLTLTAVSRFNMARRHVPAVPIQPRCPWIFPPSTAFHQQAADDRTSPFYQCGYSPTATGANARGNGTFTTCGYTKTDCVARGMYIKDSANRVTGRYGGSQWTRDSAYFKGKQYTTGNTVDGYDANVNARYGDLYPLVYGVQNITDAPVMNVFGDPNSTRFEVVVGFGQMEVLRVVVNGVVVSAGGGDVLFTWRYTNQGTRNGAPQGDSSYYKSQGDPYGSLCCIEVVVPISLQQSSSIPKVSVLAKRINVPTPNTNSAADANSWPIGYTTNPAYILLDLLVNSGNFTYADIDLATFNAAAAICNNSITYTDLKGNASATHERYRASVYYRQPKPLSERITTFRQSFLGILAPNSFQGGLLQLFIEQTLADQQSAAMGGSNYNAAITSKTAAGTTANGYVAYSFDESNILPGTLRPQQNTIGANGNRISFQFQDSENQYAQDSISQVNAAAVAAAGNQEIDSTFQVDGIENFDQASRIANIQLFKSLLGNPRNDAKGSMFFEFTTTVRATHLKAGDIVRLSWQRFSISNQLMRVRSIQGTANWEQIKLVISWHSDDWYVDTNAQNPAPLFSNPGLRVPNRDPYPWKPAGESPIANDAIYGKSPSFRISLKYLNDAAGNPIPSISVQGYPPANALSDTAFPPLVPLQGTTANTGGTIVPGDYVFALAGIDANTPAKTSALSAITHVTIPAGTSTNTATVPSLYFQPGTSTYKAYFGYSESTLQQVGSGTSSDSAFTLTAFPPAFLTGYSPPDVKFSEFITQTFHEIHGGLWAIPVTSVSGAVLTFDGQAFPDNFYVGCIASLIGQASPGVRQPIMNLPVTANTATTVTLSASVSSAVQAGDLILMRMSLTTVGNLTIGDSKLQNTIYPTGLSVNTEAGLLMVVIAGTGKGQSQSIASNTATTWTLANPLNVALDATSVIVILDPSPIEKPSDKITFDGRINTFGPPTVATIPSPNYSGEVLFIRALTADTNGNHGPEYLAPFREIYIAGQSSSLSGVQDPGYYNVTPDASGNVTIDLGNGFNQRLVLTDGVAFPVPNGDFETGLQTPWLDFTITNAVTNTESYNGSFSLMQVSGTGSAYQDISGLVSGRKYTFAVKVKSSASSVATGSLVVSDSVTGGATTVTANLTPGSTEWSEISVVYTATSNPARVQLWRNSGTGTIYWDAVTADSGRPKILAPVYTGGTITAALPPLTLYVDQDTTGDWLGPRWASGSGAWTTDFQQQDVAFTKNTRTVYMTQRHAAVWALDSHRTGGAVS